MADNALDLKGIVFTSMWSVENGEFLGAWSDLKPHDAVVHKAAFAGATTTTTTDQARNTKIISGVTIEEIYSNIAKHSLSSSLSSTSRSSISSSINANMDVRFKYGRDNVPVAVIISPAASQLSEIARDDQTKTVSSINNFVGWIDVERLKKWMVAAALGLGIASLFTMPPDRLEEHRHFLQSFKDFVESLNDLVSALEGKEPSNSRRRSPPPNSRRRSPSPTAKGMRIWGRAKGMRIWGRRAGT